MLQNETPRFAVANILVRFCILATWIKYVHNLKIPILILKIHAEIAEIA